MRTLLAVVCVGMSACLGVATERPEGDVDVDAGDVDAGLSAVDAGLGDGGLVRDAGALDAGPDAGTVDAGPAQVPVFLLVGKQGRRAISCDDGRTWTHDVSLDEAWPATERYRCFSGNVALPDGGTQSTDCDHNALSSTSLTFFDGVFFHTMGWGEPGTFHRSTDGLTWTQVSMGTNVQDVLVGPNRLIAAARYTRRSDDRGLTWNTTLEVPVSNGANTIWNIRGGLFGGRTFLMTAQDGTNVDFAYSHDNGQTWQRPTLDTGARVDVCAAGHPAFGAGVFVTATYAPAESGMVVCRSTDDAVTWTVTRLPNVNVESRLLWTGTEFVMWSPGKVHRSADGLTWRSASTQTRKAGVLGSGPNLGAVAVNAAGTFVAVRGGWNVWYEQQRFYRSTDGVVWDELPTGAYTPGHPVTAMISGVAPRCP